MLVHPAMRNRIFHSACCWLKCAAIGFAFVSPSRAAVDFEMEIKPIIESACLHCHNETKSEGDLRLDSFATATAQREGGPAIVPGDAAKSTFYTHTVLPAGDAQIMPPEGDPLDDSQTNRLKAWIEEGAIWPEATKLVVQPRIDFVKNVQPILETNCVSCHSGSDPEGGFDLSTHQSALESGNSPPSIIPFHSEESSLYKLTIVQKDDPALMPPIKEGGPLGKEISETLRFWISQGAIWPKNIVLKTRTKKPTGPPSHDDMELVRRIHDLIIEKSKVTSEAEMVDYAAKIPQTKAPYQMVAIKRGEFLMGSPESEKGRQDVEGPQAQVQIAPFWLGRYEVTWDEYEPYMITRVERFKNGARKDYDPAIHTDLDAVSGPTTPYVEMSFGMGQHGFPAISMTQHAANKYCQWLSAQTGHFYRLPTEAEWEYACRAGTTTAYSFGDDPAELEKFAWFRPNSDEKYQKVGQKKPNPWGLYDMHGNVAEWTADQFLPNYFKLLGPEVASNPFLRPEALYPRSVRGGGWDHDPDQLRSASRLGSGPIWQQQDPQLPKSLWYLTDAPWLGFRIARPLTIPSVEEMYFYWNSSTDKH